MRILQVNKFYYRRGGAETYLFDLMKLLADQGHEIVPFAMKHPENEENGFESFFIDEVDYNATSPWYSRIHQAGRMIYSFHAANRMKALLNIAEPSIAHVHNIYHQVSPSILDVLGRREIPVVMTLHDYKLACPNYKMRTKGEVCERCVPRNFYRAAQYRCVKDSLLASIACATELYLHRYTGIYEKNVKFFVTPSNALKGKMAASGIPEDKLKLLPNFAHVGRFTPSYEATDYLIYFGRLAEEKGLLTLLESMRKFASGRLVIVGDGPLAGTLQRTVVEQGLSNVQLIGRKSGTELEDLIRGARATVLPSQWYENCPISVIESYASGTPVLGANIGGIPEMIEDGRTGLLFEPFSPEDLLAKIEHIYGDDELVEEMGRNARLKAEREFDSALHLDRLLGIYEEALA